MAIVAVRTKDEAPDLATTVTRDNFKAWKRRRGRNAAFVVRMPGDQDDDGSVLVCTFADMCKLPAGNYQAQLVQKCTAPATAKKELRGTDLWKCI